MLMWFWLTSMISKWLASPEQAAGDPDLDVVFEGRPDRVRLLDLHPVLVAEEVEVVLDGVLVGPLAEDAGPRAVEVPGRFLERAQPGQGDEPAGFFFVDLVHGDILFSSFLCAASFRPVPRIGSAARVPCGPLAR